MSYHVVINGPLKQTRISFDNRAEAEKLRDRIAVSKFAVWVEDEKQAERETAPMIKPQPKGTRVDGWDI